MLEKSVTFELKDISHVQLICGLNECDGGVEYDLGITAPTYVPKCDKCSRELTSHAFTDSIPGFLIHMCRAFRTRDDMTLKLKLHVPLRTNIFAQNTGILNTTVVFTPEEITRIDFLCSVCDEYIGAHNFLGPILINSVSVCQRCGHSAHKAPHWERGGIQDMIHGLEEYHKQPRTTPSIKFYIPTR